MTAEGHSALPPDKVDALRRAKKLEWITLPVMGAVVASVGLVAGQSQAMRTAFAEDLLALLPPIAFLIGVWRSGKGRSPRHPYGHHRAMSAGHLVSAVALLGFGLSLLYNGVMTLVKQERPPIGVMHLFGYAIWAGWPMIVVMALSVVPPMILGRMKLKLARELHDEVLAADADMNKADWSTGLATIGGVIGIGFGLWWADAVAAILVSASIVRDGVSNLRYAFASLLDARAAPLDSADPDPVIDKLRTTALAEPWVTGAVARVRDMGHVFHSEVFVVTDRSLRPHVDDIESLRQKLRQQDWKVGDETFVIVVPELPDGIRDPVQ